MYEDGAVEEEVFMYQLFKSPAGSALELVTDSTRSRNSGCSFLCGPDAGVVSAYLLLYRLSF